MMRFFSYSVNPTSNSSSPHDVEIGKDQYIPVETGKENLKGMELVHQSDRRFPIAVTNQTYLEQVAQRAVYRTLDASRKAEFSSNSLKPLSVTVSISDILSIDPVKECWTFKYRLYLFWEDDYRSEEDRELSEQGDGKDSELRDVESVRIDRETKLGKMSTSSFRNSRKEVKNRNHDPFKEFFEKAIENGHSYQLTRQEVDYFLTHHPLPRVLVFNQIESQETDQLDIRVYGGLPGKTAFMANQSFLVTCRERFHLQDFPFDLQYLSLNFIFNDIRTFMTYEFHLNSVQLNTDCLKQVEWRLLTPYLKPEVRKTAGIHVKIPITRKVKYYIRHVIMIIIVLSFLGLSAFAFQTADLTGRTSIELTLILTSVAFKFTIMQNALPKVSYSTILDYYIAINFWSLVLQTIFCMVPYIYGINTNIRNYRTFHFYSQNIQWDDDTLQTDDYHGPINWLNFYFTMISIGCLVIGFGWAIGHSYWTYEKNYVSHYPIPKNMIVNHQWISFHFQNAVHLVEYQEGMPIDRVLNLPSRKEQSLMRRVIRV